MRHILALSFMILVSCKEVTVKPVGEVKVKPVVRVSYEDYKNSNKFTLNYKRTNL